MDGHYRVLVASIGIEAGTNPIARYLRDQGHEVIAAPHYDTALEGGESVAQAAIQEDVDMIDLTVSATVEPRVNQYLSDMLAQYDAEDIDTDLHYPPKDPGRARWTQLDQIGPTNGQLLSEAGLDPDTATFKDVWNALADGYTSRLDDEQDGMRVGRAQAKNIRRANEDRYGDEPTPDQQSSISWWAKQYSDTG